MGATFDDTVTVNVFGAAQAVEKRGFGNMMVMTDDLEVGFTETHRYYESNNAGQTDADLQAAAKSIVSTFFSQRLQPKRVGIGKAAALYASISTTLDALLAAVAGTDDDFYVVACFDRTKATQQAVAEWAAANNRLALIASSDADILAGTGGNLFDTLSSASNGRAAGLYHATDTELCDVAWGAMGLWQDPDVKSPVWYDQTLTGIVPDDVDSSEKTAVEADGGNLYLTLKKVGATGPGKVFDGTWLDEVIIKDWLKARIEEDVSQYRLDQAARGERIPYTQNGLEQVAGVIRARCRKGQTIGHFAPGKTSIVLAVPDIADVLPATITAREATIPVTCTLSGGIREITINVGVI